MPNGESHSVKRIELEISIVRIPEEDEYADILKIEEMCKRAKLEPPPSLVTMKQRIEVPFKSEQRGGTTYVELDIKELAKTFTVETKPKYYVPFHPRTLRLEITPHIVWD